MCIGLRCASTLMVCLVCMVHAQLHCTPLHSIAHLRAEPCTLEDCWCSLAQCASCSCAHDTMLHQKRKEKTKPFGVNAMSSHILYQAAQSCYTMHMLPCKQQTFVHLLKALLHCALGVASVSFCTCVSCTGCLLTTRKTTTVQARTQH